MIEVVGSISLQREVTIYLSTSDLTAVGKVYYLRQIKCSTLILYLTDGINYKGMTNYSLTFNSTKIENTVNISIIATNETQPEMDEEFTVSLSFPGEPIPRVTLEPDNATVKIFEVNGQSMIKVHV